MDCSLYCGQYCYAPAVEELFQAASHLSYDTAHLADSLKHNGTLLPNNGAWKTKPSAQQVYSEIEYLFKQLAKVS